MFRTKLFIAAMSFPLLIGGCGDDATPPSGPRTEDQPRPAARMSAATVDRLRLQVRQVGAQALFFSSDPSRCAETDVFVFAAEDTRKSGPGKPTTGPIAVVAVFDVDFCTGEVLRQFSGFTDDLLVQADRRKLSEASLQTTIAAIDDVSGAEVRVEIDLAWKGTGGLVSQSNRVRLKTPSSLVSQSSKGTFRDAALSGTVVVDGENVAIEQQDFAEIFRLRTGEFVMGRLR